MGQTYFFLFLILISEYCFGQENSLKYPLPPTSKNTKNKRVYDIVEGEASFPGGDTAYQNFLQLNLKAIADSAIKQKSKKGSYVIYLMFAIDTGGNVKGISAESKPKSAFLESACMEMIQKSPKWKPAIQNGRTISTIRRQPLTIEIE